jgi:hypothetical protein
VLGLSEFGFDSICLLHRVMQLWLPLTMGLLFVRPWVDQMTSIVSCHLLKILGVV